MGQTWGIVFMVIGLLVSVGLHEAGHMFFAKRFGVPVPEFAIGFGPRLWKRTVGETTYSLRAVPLGGFVRIPGMFPPARETTATTDRRGRLTLAEEARRQSMEEMPPGTEGRPFHCLPARRKVVVMLAGPAMNLLLSVALTVGALVGIGVSEPTTTVAEVVPTVTTSTGEVPSPAAQAGILPGDVVTGVDGMDVQSWSQVVEHMRSSAGKEVSLVLQRQGQPVQVTLTVAASTEGYGMVGIVSEIGQHSASPAQVGEAVWGMATGTASAVIGLPMGVWNVIVSVFTEAPRDRTGVISVVGVGRIAGEVTDSGTQRGGEGILQSFQVLLLLLASLNMALCVFNLIPLPPLDGGHVMGALYEGGRRMLARARRRPDPGPADTARLMPLTYATGAALVAMSVILVVADIIKPITLG
ncbi:site-2 protease family protein [Schaalia sp. 19OD2882]|nr:M50 family metallopeptidase [Schaalia sp. 19OD2882]QWW20684.1 site-2 protease family protein [Schaalia sp. 19OD2882]